MRRIVVTGLGLALAFFGLGFVPSVPAQTPARERGAPLEAALVPYLERYGMPALAAAVVRDGRIVASGAIGVRRLGAQAPVTIEDRFHIGSDTKAMTALLAAMLVEEGRLRWDTTVGEAFPEFVPKMSAGMSAVRLEQLLAHSSGIPSDTETHDGIIARSLVQERRNLDELRYWMVEQLVALPLVSAPGARFAYANMGYVLAGSMIERATRSTWEEMIVERVFAPLGLATAGLGPQSSLGRIDAPVGHDPRDDGTRKPMLAGPNGDNPAVLGPAGTAHMSVLDFANWVAWNAGQGRRGPALVRPETLRKLHTVAIETGPLPGAAPGTPAVGGYGFGWGTNALPFANGPVLFHGGSNRLNIAMAIVQPARDFGLVVMTNIGGVKADAGLKLLIEELYRRFAPG